MRGFGDTLLSGMCRCSTALAPPPPPARYASADRPRKQWNRNRNPYRPMSCQKERSVGELLVTISALSLSPFLRLRVFRVFITTVQTLTSQRRRTRGDPPLPSVTLMPPDQPQLYSGNCSDGVYMGTAIAGSCAVKNKTRETIFPEEDLTQRCAL